MGVMTPASPAREDLIKKGIKKLRSFGFRVKIAPGTFGRSGHYLVHPDEKRKEALLHLLEDPDVKAIFFTRGGYGTMRLLERLDKLEFPPKVYMGFSDLTVLLSLLYRKGIVSFHGPMVASHFASMTKFTEKYWKELFFKHRLLYTLKKKFVVKSGEGEGILFGGNLSLLTSTLRTPFEPPLDGTILFLEDVDEEPYRVDRMLTQLRVSGLLRGVRGILLGNFRKKRVRKEEFLEVFKDRLGDIGIPVMGILPLGHVRNTLTLPLGIKARMDTKNGVLEILEDPFR